MFNPFAPLMAIMIPITMYFGLKSGLNSIDNDQVQEKADNLEPEVAAKFLSYPIPKAIVEEWEKVK